MDIKATFYRPEVDEEVYLELPKHFKKLDGDGNKLVCKLNDSIHKLKQAAKKW